MMSMDADEKINKLCSMAEWYFIREGYHNTQIANIAAKAEMAVGSVYKIFSGKKAIFQYVVLKVFECQHIMEDKKPIRDISDEVLLNCIMDKLKKIKKNFAPEVVDLDKVPSFAEFLEMVFDMMYAYGPAFLIFERNQMDFSEICTTYSIERKKFLDYFVRCIQQYQSKNEIREIKHLEYHARLMIETMSWWGMHVRYDIHDVSIPPETAREIVLDSLVHAYVIDKKI